MMPMSPQQNYIVDLIADYLEDQVEEPRETALEIWRMTRLKRRPIITTEDDDGD